MGVGYDRLDRAALAKRGVLVCNVPGSVLPLPFNFSSIAIIGKWKEAHVTYISVQTTEQLKSPTMPSLWPSLSAVASCCITTANASHRSHRGCKSILPSSVAYKAPPTVFLDLVGSELLHACEQRPLGGTCFSMTHTYQMVSTRV